MLLRPRREAERPGELPQLVKVARSGGHDPLKDLVWTAPTPMLASW